MKKTKCLKCNSSQFESGKLTGFGSVQFRPDNLRFLTSKTGIPVKAEMCRVEDIDMIFDNSPAYAAEFSKVKTHFNLVIDKTKSLDDRRR